MSMPVHTVRMMTGSAMADQGEVRLGHMKGVANLIGGGAGQAVTTAFVFSRPMKLNSYSVFVAPNQDATHYVANKTAAGFDVVLTPRLAASTLAAGTFDLLIIA